MHGRAMLSVRGLNSQHFKPVRGRLQSVRVVASRPMAMDFEMVLDDAGNTVHSISKVEYVQTTASTAVLRSAGGIERHLQCIEAHGLEWRRIEH